MSSEVVPIMLMAAAFVLLGWVLTVSHSMDLGGPIRSWLWERDARRMQRSQRFPSQLHRAYWSRREFDRDRPRLLGLGYRITAQEAVDPYITLPSMPTFGRPNPQPRRRRVPVLYVDYAFQPSSPADAVAAHR
jgi:hypothetical protein